MAIFKILFFFIALCSKSYAVFFCEYKQNKSILNYTNQERTSSEIVEFIFNDHHFVPSYLSCASFLDQIKSNFNIHQQTKNESFQQVLTFSDTNAVRIIGDLRQELYKLCAKSLGCKLRFPFSLLNYQNDDEDFKDYFKKFYPYCLENKNIIPVKEKVIPSKSLFDVEYTFDIKNKNILAEYYSIMDSAQWDKIYISTMTFSPDFLKKIIAKRGSSKTQIHLIFSFGLQSLIQDFPAYLYNLPSNITVHPIFLSSEAKTSYHIKGALFVGKHSKYLFFTGNFRNYDDEPFSDMAMVANIKDVQRLEEFFQRQISRNCLNKEFAACSLETRFEGNSPSKDLLNSILEKSCSLTNEVPSDSAVAYGPRNTNISKMVHDFVMGANKSIKIQTHQLNDPELIQILKTKVAKGISVQVIKGRSKTVDNQSETFIMHNSSQSEYHSKYIILDDSRLLWTTGNFTKTSYTNPWEMTYHFEDALLLKEFTKNFQQNIKEINHHASKAK